MPKMTTCLYTVSITVTMQLLYPSTVMSEPWRKSSNQTKIHYPPTLPQNQLVSVPHPSALPTVTCCPANANQCIPPFKKTQMSSDPVLLISPIPHWYNIKLTLGMLNPSRKDSTSSNLLNQKSTLKLTSSKQD